MNVVFLAVAVVLFVLAAINDAGWITINNASVLVLLGLAFFAGSFLPWRR